MMNGRAQNYRVRREGDPGSTRSSAQKENTFSETHSEPISSQDRSDTCSSAVAMTCAGIVAILLSIFLLFFTERDYIAKQSAVNHIDDTLIALHRNSPIPPILKSSFKHHERRKQTDIPPPVYINDILSIGEMSDLPMDPQFDIGLDAMVLSKTTEMYQWVETKETQRSIQTEEGAQQVKTTYSYTKEWKSNWIDADKFHKSEYYYNPPNEVLSNPNANQQWQTLIYLGDYRLSPPIALQLINDASEYWKNSNSKVWKAHNLEGFTMRNGYLYVSNSGDESYEPTIGDIRIDYKTLDLRGQSASFLGKITVHSSSGDTNGERATLGEWYAKSQHSFSFIRLGDFTPDFIIDTMRDSNVNTLYLLRIVTFAIMVLGFVLSGAMLNYLVSFLPCGFGRIIGVALNVIAFAVGAVVWLFVFFVAYFVARIEIALAVLAIVIIALLTMQYLGARKRSFHKQD